MKTTPTDLEVADTLDALARALSHVRQVLPRLSLDQFDTLARCAPWDDWVEDALLDADVWSVVAAAEFRGVMAAVGT